jgi:hypothetical protein
MVFGMAADVWPNAAGSISSLWSAGYADFILLEPSMGSMSMPNSTFISQCNAVGASPIFQTSDSSTGGCYGGCSAYYASIAKAGIQAAGGESGTGTEDAAIMENLIFYNMGGEGTGGVTGNNDIFGGREHAKVTGYGCASYLKSYTKSGVISIADMGTAAGVNKDAGCYEVGIVVGDSSQSSFGANVEFYELIVDEYASNGVLCAGFMCWAMVKGGDFQSPGVMTTLMTKYTPIQANIKSRFAGKAGAA